MRAAAKVCNAPISRSANGIYKSTDGGATWTHLGLRDGQQIASMAVDPKNANRLFVAVLGHPYGPNSERGIYRSLDGGATFTQVLYKNENVGAFGVALDPQQSERSFMPRSGRRDRRRGRSVPRSRCRAAASSNRPTAERPGRSWPPDCPTRIGRAEIAVAPSDSQVVYAYADVESKGQDAGALYRSDDAGAHFAKVNDAA